MSDDKLQGTPIVRSLPRY